MITKPASVSSASSLFVSLQSLQDIRLVLDDFSQQLRDYSSDFSRLSARLAFYSGVLYELEQPKEK